MIDILTRAGCFVAIIFMGYALRCKGVFKKEDFYLLSKIVIRITLTAAIITNFAGRELEYSMLILSIFGIGFGIFMMAFTYVLNKRKGRDAQSFAMLNSSGCNIGNFAMPFAQSFLGPVGVMAVSLFDVGNSFICLGGAFGMASIVKDENKKFSLMNIFRALLKSIPFITYMVMTVVCAFHIPVPKPIVEFAGIVGNANAFMAMLMLGVGFQLSGDRSQIMKILRIVIPRYGFGILFAVLSFTLLPLPLEYRQALSIVFLAPIASAAPAFTAEMESDYGLASAINSISILISIVLIVIDLLIVL